MSIQQHEPLRIPDTWDVQERQMIAQLERILDDIYRRFNRLKISDLDKTLREELKTTISDTGDNKIHIEGLTEFQNYAQEKINGYDTKLSNAGIDDGVNLDKAVYPIHGEHVRITKDAVETDYLKSGTTEIDGNGYIRLGSASVSQGGYITGKKIISDDNYVRSKGISIPVIISKSEPTEKGVIWINPVAEITQYVATVPHDIRTTGKAIDITFPTLMRSGDAISGDECLYLIELYVRNKSGECKSTNLSLYITDAQASKITIYAGQDGRKGPNDLYYIYANTTLTNLTESAYMFMHLLLNKDEKTTVFIPAGTKITLTCIASGTNNCEVKFLS